mmetsp:Transcript_76617/g.228330  ORF Transcript_76617/g.228330 Transcript_76617/m.228330 type:complete len:438 (+) Transcript_76617:378-1691(+)
MGRLRLYRAHLHWVCPDEVLLEGFLVHQGLEAGGINLRNPRAVHLRPADPGLLRCRPPGVHLGRYTGRGRAPGVEPRRRLGRSLFAPGGLLVLLFRCARRPLILNCCVAGIAFLVDGETPETQHRRNQADVLALVGHAVLLLLHLKDGALVDDPVDLSVDVHVGAQGLKLLHQVPPPLDRLGLRPLGLRRLLLHPPGLRLRLHLTLPGFLERRCSQQIVLPNVGLEPGPEVDEQYPLLSAPDAQDRRVVLRHLPDQRAIEVPPFVEALDHLRHVLEAKRVQVRLLLQLIPLLLKLSAPPQQATPPALDVGKLAELAVYGRSMVLDVGRVIPQQVLREPSQGIEAWPVTAECSPAQLCLAVLLVDVPGQGIQALQEEWHHSPLHEVEVEVLLQQILRNGDQLPPHELLEESPIQLEVLETLRSTSRHGPQPLPSDPPY